jgi:hypothetical protein
MSDEEQIERFVVDRRGVPEQYPTHRHEPEFWEALGRCVATFGFLEDIGKGNILAHGNETVWRRRN